MRELLLLRHAKSSWDDPSLDDFDRPLAGRGQKAALVMAREIVRRGWSPDTVFVSTALRTRQTWQLAAPTLGERRPRAVYDDALYMASAEQIMACIRRSPETKQRLLVLGHNPGLEELALELAGPGSDDAALARLRAKFPTAAMARFEVAGKWSSLAPSTARLCHFLRPKDIE